MERQQAFLIGGGLLAALGVAVVASRGTGPPTPLPPPQTPTGLTASAVTATRATLTWNAATYADTYEIWRDAILAFTTTALTVTDSTVSPLTAYQYAVLARNGSGASAPSAPVTVTTPALPPNVPATPVGLTAVVA